LLAYNVGVGRLLGYGKHPKSRLLRKIEAGNRNIYREYVSFCRYKGKVLNGLVKRRQVEFALFLYTLIHLFLFCKSTTSTSSLQLPIIMILVFFIILFTFVTIQQ
jgi:lysozyme